MRTGYFQWILTQGGIMLFFDGKKIKMESTLRSASFDGDHKLMSVSCEDGTGNSVNFISRDFERECPHLYQEVTTEVKEGLKYKLIAMTTDKYNNISYEFMSEDKEQDILILGTNFSIEMFKLAHYYDIVNTW
jgi:hypothetical protein